MARQAAAVDNRYPFWVRNEGYEPTLVDDEAEHLALLAERGLPATLPPTPLPAMDTPPARFFEYPKSVGAFVVEDAEEERMARAIDATDPDAIAALREKIAEHRARLETALVLADREDYCEFPKWVDGPDGRIIVHSAAEGQAAREAAAEKAARAFTFQPSPKARQTLDQAAADGRDLSEVISTALELGVGTPSAVGAIEFRPWPAMPWPCSCRLRGSTRAPPSTK